MLQFTFMSVQTNQLMQVNVCARSNEIPYRHFRDIALMRIDQTRS